MLSHKVFVINLERSPERLAVISSRLNEFDIPFERVEAIDGKTLSDSVVEEVSPAHVVSKTYHRSLSKAEVACSLSHRKAWRKIVEDDLDFAIVLEDDAEILDNFPRVLDLLAELPCIEWDFIKLYALKRGGEKNVARRFDYRDHTFVTYHKFPLGFQGQAISRQGARSLIERLPYVTEPADSQLKSWWEAGVFPFGLVPYCVSTDVGGPSDINPHGRLEKMKQNRYVKLVNNARRALLRIWWTPKLNKKFDQFAQALQ